ncbi:MAG: nickel insertion protein, partial [Geminicoccaceae bacterium]|nr:nickel insertion protein [Geminicoccaceae bacterium]
VDDMTPEALALGLDRVRAIPGVLDVLQLTGLGKKGRLAVQVQVLTRPDALEDAVEACFAQTTTIGLRQRVEERTALPRTERVADGVRLKVVERPSGRTAKAESEDLSDLPDHAGRERRRRAAEAAADEDQNDE